MKKDRQGIHIMNCDKLQNVTINNYNNFNQEDAEDLAENITEALTREFSWEWSLDVQNQVKICIGTAIQEYFIDPDIL